MESRNFVIRPAAESDRVQWEKLWQGYLDFYRSSLAPETTETLWQRLLDPQHGIEARLAEARGNLLGLVHYFPHPHTWYAEPVCYLNDLFVSPAVRGGGIGAALIQSVIGEARRYGWAEVYWHTQQDNATARGLYDKITGGSDGFVNYCVQMSSLPAD